MCVIVCAERRILGVTQRIPIGIPNPIFIITTFFGHVLYCMHTKKEVSRYDLLRQLPGFCF